MGFYLLGLFIRCRLLFEFQSALAFLVNRYSVPSSPSKRLRRRHDTRIDGGGVAAAVAMHRGDCCTGSAHAGAPVVAEDRRPGLPEAKRYQRCSLHQKAWQQPA